VLELGKRLKEIRKSKNLNAAELSQQSGVARSLISQLESGKRQSTSIDTVYRLAKALDVPVASLLAETPVTTSYAAKHGHQESSLYFKEGDLAYLQTLRKAKEAGLTPELLNELIDVILRIRK